MFHSSDMWFIFQPTQKKFIIHTGHTCYISYCYVQYHGLYKQENPLLGIVALWTWLRIHPCWSLAQSQLPHFKTLPLNTRPIPPFQANTATLYIQMTLSCPNLLLLGILPCWCWLSTVTLSYSCPQTGKMYLLSCPPNPQFSQLQLLGTTMGPSSRAPWWSSLLLVNPTPPQFCFSMPPSSTSCTPFLPYPPSLGRSSWRKMHPPGKGFLRTLPGTTPHNLGTSEWWPPSRIWSQPSLDLQIPSAVGRQRIWMAWWLCKIR